MVIEIIITLLIVLTAVILFIKSLKGKAACCQDCGKCTCCCSQSSNQEKKK